MPSPIVLLIGTCDTKLSELLFVKSHIKSHEVTVWLLDVGREPVSHPEITYSHIDIFDHASEPIPDFSSTDRGELINTLIEAATPFVRHLHSGHHFGGAITIGGSCGTSLASAIMHNALPVGLPKLLVSTVASGDVSTYIGHSDITIMNSVVDIAGQNSILNPILANAAAMIAGTAKAYIIRRLDRQKEEQTRPDRKQKMCIAISMFGVTTPCCSAARRALEDGGYEVIVFHTTGQGGKAMESLISEGHFAGVLDITTSELADELVGGNMSAGAHRLEAASREGVPQVVGLGACDVVNFGRMETVPERFRAEGRKLHVHNPAVTIMRTNKEECKALGGIVAEKLRMHAEKKEMVNVFVPKGGLSVLGSKGGVFEDKEADEVLFASLKEGLRGCGIDVQEDQRDLNDEGFATDMAEALMRMIEMRLTCAG